MYTYCTPRTGKTGQRVITTLDSQWADVNGDGIRDNVSLVGNKMNGFSDNIFLTITDGMTGSTTRIPLQNNAGYNARLFLGDFNFDKLDDILVVIDSGGSGGYIFAYLFSYRYNQLSILFSSDAFNQLSQYKAVFQNNYKVDVINLFTGKTYTLDISNKKADYSSIYDINGKLIRPVQGEVLALGGVSPVDFNNNGTFDLVTSQRIIGLSNADTLGYLNTILRWNGAFLEPIKVGINIPIPYTI